MCRLLSEYPRGQVIFHLHFDSIQLSFGPVEDARFEIFREML